jgi:acyl-CoA synthetase (AMP-forming)/AMP-acid ligase II
MREFVELGCATAQPTISSLLIGRAAQQPGRIAYTFLSSNGGEEHVTYSELDRRARTIACQLTESGANGKRVVLLYPPGINYISAFFGCMYAGSIAVPAMPPDPLRLDRSLPRIAAILRDAMPSILLTTSANCSSLSSLLAYARQLHVQVLATDSQPEGSPPKWEPVQDDPESIAVLHYTSGSTATTKGIVLTHRNLLTNSELICRFFGHSEESRGMLWLPPHHDMGLVGGIIQPLYGGFPITLMAPEDFIAQPVRWLREISRTRATISGGPDYAYELCVRKSTAQERRQLDLSSWRVAFNSAEPIHAATMERFAHAFRPAGFRPEAFHPCYGLAEATFMVAGGVAWSARETKSLTLQPGPAMSQRAGARSHRVVSCGPAAPSHCLAIVDPSTRAELPPGQVGEIWVSGPSVAQGYWRRPDETGAVFRARLAGSGDGPFLRTGDLGFILGGQLFVTGRIKDMIIVRGSSHYPQDIELTAQHSHSALRPGGGAAFTVQVGDEERLVVAHEMTSPPPAGVEAVQIADAIRTAVTAEHGLDVHSVVLLPPGGIPKTSGGKVQRGLCAAMFEERQLTALACGTVDYAAGAGRAWPESKSAEERHEPKDPAARRARQSGAHAPANDIPARDDVPVGCDAPARGDVPAAGRIAARWYRWQRGSRVPAEQHHNGSQTGNLALGPRRLCPPAGPGPGAGFSATNTPGRWAIAQCPGVLDRNVLDRSGPSRNCFRPECPSCQNTSNTNTVRALPAPETHALHPAYGK